MAEMNENMKNGLRSTFLEELRKGKPKEQVFQMMEEAGRDSEYYDSLPGFFQELENTLGQQRSSQELEEVKEYTKGVGEMAGLGAAQLAGATLGATLPFNLATRFPALAPVLSRISPELGNIIKSALGMGAAGGAFRKGTGSGWVEAAQGGAGDIALALGQGVGTLIGKASPILPTLSRMGGASLGATGANEAVEYLKGRTPTTPERLLVGGLPAVVEGAMKFVQPRVDVSDKIKFFMSRGVSEPDAISIAKFTESFTPGEMKAIQTFNLASESRAALKRNFPQILNLVDMAKYAKDPETIAKLGRDITNQLDLAIKDQSGKLAGMIDESVKGELKQPEDFGEFLDLYNGLSKNELSKIRSQFGNAIDKARDRGIAAKKRFDETFSMIENLPENINLNIPANEVQDMLTQLRNSYDGFFNAYPMAEKVAKLEKVNKIINNLQNMPLPQTQGMAPTGLTPKDLAVAYKEINGVIRSQGVTPSSAALKKNLRGLLGKMLESTDETKPIFPTWRSTNAQYSDVNLQPGLMKGVQTPYSQDVMKRDLALGDTSRMRSLQMTETDLAAQQLARKAPSMMKPGSPLEQRVALVDRDIADSISTSLGKIKNLGDGKKTLQTLTSSIDAPVGSAEYAAKIAEWNRVYSQIPPSLKPKVDGLILTDYMAKMNNAVKGLEFNPTDALKLSQKHSHALDNIQGGKMLYPENFSNWPEIVATSEGLQELKSLMKTIEGIKNSKGGKPAMKQLMEQMRNEWGGDKWTRMVEVLEKQDKGIADTFKGAMFEEMFMGPDGIPDPAEFLKNYRQMSPKIKQKVFGENVKLIDEGLAKIQPVVENLSQIPDSETSVFRQVMTSAAGAATMRVLGASIINPLDLGIPNILINLGLFAMPRAYAGMLANRNLPFINKLLQLLIIRTSPSWSTPFKEEKTRRGQ